MKRLALLIVATLSITCGTDGPAPIQARTTVMWLFDSYPSLGIAEGDNCTDLAVDTVKVDMAGPETASLTDGCTNRQVVFMGLTPGDYTATLTPIDALGATLTKTPTSVHVTAGSTDTSVTINVPWDSWANPYHGTFYFKITWDGMDCTTAMPVVLTQTVTLSQGGTPITLKNDTGHKVDGTDPEPCRGGSTAVEFVAQVPFGPATIGVKGTTGGTFTYTKQWDTFVGAGLSNPTIVYDIPGIDAMPPDAMPDAN